MKLKPVAVAAFAALLIVVATVWATAQAVATTPVTPMVMSGADVGFRVEGIRGNTPVGTLVVKVKGEWVEVDIQKLSTRSLRP